jgi:hypothetical protein
MSINSIPTADSREQERAPVHAVAPRSRVAGLIDRRTARVIGTLVIFAAIAAFIYGARRVIVVFLLAIFLAYLLNPAVSWVECRSPLSRNSRGSAILQVYVVIAILVALLFTVVGTSLVEEGRKLSRDLPGLMQNLSTGHLAAQIGAKRGWSYETQQRAEELLAAHRDAIVRWAQSFGSYAASLAVNAIWIILIPILAIFFLRDGWKFADAVIATTDRRRQKQFVRDMVADLDHIIGGSHSEAATLQSFSSMVARHRATPRRASGEVLYRWASASSAPREPRLAGKGRGNFPDSDAAFFPHNMHDAEFGFGQAEGLFSRQASLHLLRN